MCQVASSCVPMSEADLKLDLKKEFINDCLKDI